MADAEPEMTRAEHRAEATRLAAESLAAGDGNPRDGQFPYPRRKHLADLALVHATLATSVRPIIVNLGGVEDLRLEELEHFAEVLKEALQ